ncbi:MAG: chemotaxis protein CheX [Defluviitaleaceae bacterium]|nr:chemotaxis protein CheX [Defluviitaleaceae bacterium]
MDVSYVNAIVQGAQRVFKSVCNETPSLGKVSVKTHPYTVSPVSVSIGLIGAFEGEIVYNMDESAGCFFASRLMMGMPVDALDDMAKSALSELANIISGNVATVFSGKKILIDIKPPKIRLGATAADFPNVVKVPKIVCVPLHFANGSVFEIHVAIP